MLRSRYQGCIDRRFAELQLILDRSQDGAEVPSPIWVGQPPFWPVSTARWDTAVGGGRASLIPSSELARYAGVYKSLGFLEEQQEREQQFWSQLRAMEGLRKAPPEAIQALRRSLAEARYADARIKLSAGRALVEAKNAGVRPGPAEVPGRRSKVASVCVPLATSRADALRIIQSPFGEP